MNLVYGEIVDMFEDDGVFMGRVRVRGAIRKIPLDLLPSAGRGDHVLICDGVAIGTVEIPTPTKEELHVPGHPR